MFQTLKNAWKTPELRGKILFTILILLLYRLGASIFVPYVNSSAVASYFAASGGGLGLVDMLSGGAFSQGTLFALNVSPYITASIVIQLLTIAIPALERLSKQGEEGRQKINAITRYLTIGLAVVTAIGYATLIISQGLSTMNMTGLNKSKFFIFEIFRCGYGFQFLVIVACLVAGSSVIMWLAERINEHGIGNGISMILFANILSSVFGWVRSLWTMTFTNTGFNWVGCVIAVGTAILALAMMVLIVWFTESERRIPIQYAKRQVGRKMYGGQTSNLPLKMNMAGVMPVIFASSITSMPGIVAQFWPNSGFAKFVNGTQAMNYTDGWFNSYSWLYLVVSILLIFVFSYFYIMISFNPVEVANNIKNQGGSVPGIRPGKPTSDYIKKILNRITTMGAVFLTLVACVPMLISIINGIIMRANWNPTTQTFSGNFIQLPGIAFAGTSMLIVVGVALETFRSLESQLAMRNYKGFLD